MQPHRKAFIADYQNWIRQDGHTKDIHRQNIQLVRNTQRINDYRLKRRAHINNVTHLTVLHVIRGTMAIPSNRIINRSDNLREDLHADAFDIWDIAIELEVELNICFTDATPDNWRTVYDVIDSIKLVRAIQSPSMFLVRQSS